MRLPQLFRVTVVFLIIFVFGRVVNYTSRTMRTIAQKNPILYQVILTGDAMNFLIAGGGAFGYDNYFKWNYATWRASSERTWWQKILFWDVGLIYDASNPPKEYAYPSRFHQPS